MEHMRNLSSLTPQINHNIQNQGGETMLTAIVVIEGPDGTVVLDVDDDNIKI